MANYLGHGNWKLCGRTVSTKCQRVQRSVVEYWQRLGRILLLAAAFEVLLRINYLLLKIVNKCARHGAIRPHRFEQSFHRTRCLAQIDLAAFYPIQVNAIGTEPVFRPFPDAAWVTIDAIRSPRREFVRVQRSGPSDHLIGDGGGITRYRETERKYFPSLINVVSISSRRMQGNCHSIRTRLI